MPTLSDGSMLCRLSVHDKAAVLAAASALTRQLTWGSRGKKRITKNQNQMGFNSVSRLGAATRRGVPTGGVSYSVPFTKALLWLCNVNEQKISFFFSVAILAQAVKRAVAVWVHLLMLCRRQVGVLAFAGIPWQWMSMSGLLDNWGGIGSIYATA